MAYLNQIVILIFGLKQTQIYFLSITSATDSTLAFKVNRIHLTEKKFKKKILCGLQNDNIFF